MPSYTSHDLRAIFDRTHGRCGICGRRLSFRRYGCYGGWSWVRVHQHSSRLLLGFRRFWLRFRWEVDHEIPRRYGGPDTLINLLPACVSCNRMRKDLPLSEARATIGRRRRRRRLYLRLGLWTVYGLLIGILVVLQRTTGPQPLFDVLYTWWVSAVGLILRFLQDMGHLF